MADENQDSIHAVHDRFVKDFMHDPSDAADVFRAVLPPSLAGSLRWEELRQEPSEFINEHLGMRSSDLLFSIPWGERELKLFLLFEHQSTHEPLAVLRTSEYKNACYRHQQKQCEGPNPVICIIFYHGKETWRAPDNFGEWLNLDRDQIKEAKLSTAQKEYLLLDVSCLEIETLQAQATVKARLELLKSRQNGTEMEWFHKYLAFMFEWLNEPEEHIRVITLLRYCLRATPLSEATVQNSIHHLPYAKTIMNAFKTAGDQLIEEGIEVGTAKGLEQGLEQGLRQGLRQGLETGLRKGILIGEIHQLERIAKLRQTPKESLIHLSIEQLEARRKKLESYE